MRDEKPFDKKKILPKTFKIKWFESSLINGSVKIIPLKFIFGRLEVAAKLVLEQKFLNNVVQPPKTNIHLFKLLYGTDSIFMHRYKWKHANSYIF